MGSEFMQKPLFLTVSKSYFPKYNAKCFVLLCAILFSHEAVGGEQVSDEEPAICQQLQPPESKSEQLVDWLLQNGSKMKQEGCWQTYIQLGTQGMQEAAAQSRYQERVRIAMDVSSMYFYLGDYDDCRKLAEEASNYAHEHEDWDGYVSSLSLLSGVARAQGHKEAIDYAEKGMEVLQKQRSVDPYLEAKTLYNLGAALSDVGEPDLDRARVALVKSYALYHYLNNPYEIVRSGLRLARIDYLDGDYDRALTVIRSIEPLIEGARSQMLYHFMLAKIHHRKKNWGKARAEALESLALADRLNAKVDGERARAWLAAIDNKTFVED